MTIDFGKVKFDLDPDTFRMLAEIESITSQVARQFAQEEERRLRAIFEEAFCAGTNFAKGGPDFDEWLDGFITEHQEA